MGKVAKNVSNAVGKAVKDTGHAAGTALQQATPFLGAIPGIGTVTGGVLGGLGGLLAPGGNLGSALGGAVKGAGGGLLGGLTGLGGITKSLTSGIPGLGSVGGGLQSLLGGLGGAGGQAMGGLESLLGGLGGAAGGAIGGLGSLLGGAASGGEDLLKKLFAGGGAGSDTGEQKQGTDWTKILATIGGTAGLAAIGGGNPIDGLKKLLAPQALHDPKSDAGDAFSKTISDALANGGSVGDVLAQLASVPGYNGQLTAGLNTQQQHDLLSSNTSLESFLSGDQGQGALATIAGMANGGQGLVIPDELKALMGSAAQNTQTGALQGLASGDNSLMAQIQALAQQNPNSNIMSLLTGQQNLGMNAGGQIQDLISQFTNGGLAQLSNQSYANPFLQSLGSANFASPEQSMLQALAMSGGDTTAQTTLQNLINSGQASSLLSGGAGTDLNQISQMLQQAAQPGIDRGLRDLREQFSFSGLRNSTDLNQAAGTFLGESQAGLTGQLAQLIPGMNANKNQTSLGALQALIGGAGQIGTANTGNFSNILQALQASGQLGQGAAGLNQQAQISGADALNQLLGIKQQGASSAGSLAIQQLQAMINGQGQAGQLATGGQSNVIQALMGALNGGQQGQGQQLSALQSLLQAQGGAAAQLGQLGQGQAGLDTTNQQSQAALLAQLFGGQQGNALQAALAQPNAISQISQLAGLLTGQNYNLNQQAQTTAQGGLDAQLAEFIRQQGNPGQLLQYLGSGGPTQYGGSLPTQALSLLTAGSTLKQSK